MIILDIIIGDIDKISQNYVRLEKGTIKKEKFWIPKYLADAFDGKVLWLLTGERETRAKFQYGEEPPVEQYEETSVRSKLQSLAKIELWMLRKLV